MSTLSTRPPSPRSGLPKSKVLLVRQPVRSVRRAAMPDRTPMRLAIGVIVAIGIVGTVWLMGHLGYHLGFAPLVCVPDLLGQVGIGLSTGALIIISAPRMIFVAGLEQPAWLMVAFIMIALPAAGLGAAKPTAPGGPRPSSSIAAIAASGAIAAVFSSFLLLWWTVSPERQSLVSSLPALPADILVWHRDLQIAAGLDILAVVAASLWVVLVMRLPVPLWLRAIATSAAMFTLVVVTVAMSITNAAAAQVGTPRALCVVSPATQTSGIILGSTPQHLAIIVVEDGTTRVELRSTPEVIDVTGRRTIVDFVREFAPQPRPFGEPALSAPAGAGLVPGVGDVGGG